MTTSPSLAPPIPIPPMDQWKPACADWLEPGVLESHATRYDHILESPPLDLAGQQHYEFEVGLEIVGPGAVTVGLQDHRLRFWLRDVVAKGPGPDGGGPARCTFGATSRRAGKYRLVIANHRPDGAARTRIRDVTVDVSTREPDPRRDDDWKNEARRQWNTDHCGHDRGEGHDKGSLEYYLAIERDRYDVYAPWMPKAIGFEKYGGRKLLEIGAGLGTDHAQFARAGAITTDLDLAEGHLELARRNFAVRGLKGEFLVGDGESLPFPDESFDVVYTFGVIHHTPNTERVVDEIHRVLRPGGEAIAMVYAKHSKYYWYNVVWHLWFRQGMRRIMTVDEILSARAEWSPSGARPLVKVYTGRQCRRLFGAFRDVRVRKYQLTDEELPRPMRLFAKAHTWSRLVGWNLLVNATK